MNEPRMRFTAKESAEVADKLHVLRAERDALRRALAAFVAAYELQDANNFTDQMRDAYATASALVGGQQGD